jgi:hypothetical protein
LGGRKLGPELEHRFGFYAIGSNGRVSVIAAWVKPVGNDDAVVVKRGPFCVQGERDEVLTVRVVNA